MEKTDKFRIGIMTVVYILTAIAVLMGAFAVYNLAFVQKPWTIGVVYADVLTYAEEKPSIIDVKINGNDNNNGQNIYEIQFNSYTDSDGKGVSGLGIQCVGGWAIRHDYESVPDYVNTDGLFGGFNAAFENNFNKNDILDDENYIKQYETYAVGDFYLYSTGDGGLSYSYLPVDKLEDYLLIDIQGKFYKLTLNTYSYTTQESHKGLVGFFKNFFKAKTVTHKVKYSWFDVFNAVMQSASQDSGKEEYRKFALNFFDLSEYLTVEYKDEKGQYHPLEETSENKDYFCIPVEYSKDGATEISDTKFKMVGHSTTWSYYNDTKVQDYWNAETEIVIDESQLNYIYYKSYGEYFLTIDKQFTNYLRTLPNAVIKVKINLANKTRYEIGGIDLQNFNFDVESFEILGANDGFKILNQDKCSATPTLIKGV